MSAQASTDDNDSSRKKGKFNVTARPMFISKTNIHFTEE